MIQSQYITNDIDSLESFYVSIKSRQFCQNIPRLMKIKYEDVVFMIV